MAGQEDSPTSDCDRDDGCARGHEDVHDRPQSLPVWHQRNHPVRLLLRYQNYKSDFVRFARSRLRQKQ